MKKGIYATMIVFLFKVLARSVEFLFAFVACYLTIALLFMSISVGGILEKKGITISIIFTKNNNLITKRYFKNLFLFTKNPNLKKNSLLENLFLMDKDSK